METIKTPQQQDVQSPRDLPHPHLPLRKASAQKLRSRHAPKPIFAPSQRSVRGFRPSPVEPVPQIDALTASSEHAFAGRNLRHPSKLPLGSLALQNGLETQKRYELRPSSSVSDAESTRPPSSPLLPSPASPHNKQKGLRGSASLGEGLRGFRKRFSFHKPEVRSGRQGTPNSVSARPSIGTDEVRQSFRSVLTSHSSALNTSSIATDRSSLATGNSSTTEFVNVYPNWPEQEEADGSVTNEDVIGMYADGFESGKQSMETFGKRSFQVGRPNQNSDMNARMSLQIERPSSAQAAETKPKRPYTYHRRSQSASLLNQGKPPPDDRLKPPQPSSHVRSSAEIMGNDNLRLSEDTRSTGKPSAQNAVSRDRYGFKKASHYITVQQYDAWDRKYSEHLVRRSKKWHALMRSYGLNTDNPYRFPPKSDKIKRYVRKGIPPEFRGPAWFWYGGGHSRLAKQSGLYLQLLEDVKNGKLSDNDREHIERDLHRTFPDNIRFKPDPVAIPAGGAGVRGEGKRASTADPEVSIVRALRRVLQAFAVHNPAIGYCQSLNFIAGLLLLFLDEDEEKAFVLLEIVTTDHLPGTHGIALEGANIDIAVLMSLIRETMEPVWRKLDDKGGGLAGDPAAQALRLPTVSLATTAWFMSLFVGTLPIESVLRVWDCLFFEGSKTLFRVALAIFRAGAKEILAVDDPMEIFQVVQTIPRTMLDVNTLIEVSFCGKRKGGFGNVSQKDIERRREERRQDVKDGVSRLNGGAISRLKGRWRSRTKV